MTQHAQVVADVVGSCWLWNLGNCSYCLLLYMVLQKYVFCPYSTWNSTRTIMTEIMRSSVLQMKVCTEVLFEQLGILRNWSLPGDNFKGVLIFRFLWRAVFYFLGVYKLFSAPLKSPRTKYYHSSLDASITLAIWLFVFWVRLGKCVLGRV